jgi:hypothetical protein
MWLIKSSSLLIMNHWNKRFWAGLWIHCTLFLLSHPRQSLWSGFQCLLWVQIPSLWFRSVCPHRPIIKGIGTPFLTYLHSLPLPRMHLTYLGRHLKRLDQCDTLKVGILVFPVDSQKITESDQSCVVLVHLRDHLVQIVVRWVKPDTFQSDLKVLPSNSPDAIL